MGNINLKEFLDGFKTTTVCLGDKERIFREPKINELQMSNGELLKQLCISNNFEEFIQETSELTRDKHKALIENIFQELGLAL